MQAIIHEKNSQKIAEIAGDPVIVKNERDALDLMVDPQLQGEEDNHSSGEYHPGFFDLSTRLAGGILQKFVTYQVKLAIVGDFQDDSASSKAFIYESNRGTEIFFVKDVETTKTKLFDAK